MWDKNNFYSGLRDKSFTSKTGCGIVWRLHKGIVSRKKQKYIKEQLLLLLLNRLSMRDRRSKGKGREHPARRARVLERLRWQVGEGASARRNLDARLRVARTFPRLRSRLLSRGYQNPERTWILWREGFSPRSINEWTNKWHKWRNK